MKTKFCKKCNSTKSVDEFVKSSKSSDGLWVYCKDCHKKWKPRVLPEMKKTRTKKQCRMCGEMKFFSEYVAGSVNNHTYCSTCRRARGFSASLSKWGLTPESYVELSKSQGDVCAICREPEKEKKRLSVDHDHKCCDGNFSCGKCIRGLLCFRCNRGLGVFGDDVSLLRKAITYLS